MRGKIKVALDTAECPAEGFAVRLSGRPRPSKNSRVKPKNLNFTVVNGKAKSWMDGARTEAGQQMRNYGLKAVRGPVSTYVEFHVRSFQHLGDGDNLIVAVNDALKGVVFEDDRPSVLVASDGWEFIVDPKMPLEDEYVIVTVRRRTISGT